MVIETRRQVTTALRQIFKSQQENVPRLGARSGQQGKLSRGAWQTGTTFYLILGGEEKDMGQGNSSLGTQGMPAKSASARPKIGTSPDTVSSAQVLSFYQFWLARCRNGRLPKKADMDPVEMRAFLSGIILTKVHRDPLDFEYRIIGEEVISRLGNMTGKRVRGGALIDLSNAAYQNYCSVVESKAPQFLEGTAMTAFRKDRPYTFSRVHCPLSDDGETVDYIISFVTFL